MFFIFLHRWQDQPLHRLRSAFYATLLSIFSTGFALAAPFQHVLLLSVDGLHAEDLQWVLQQQPHSQLAQWAAQGTVFSEARTPVPADSFPGLAALLTGAPPAVTGLWYDVAYDRQLSPPGSDCTTHGTIVRYDETIDGANGGLNPELLPRDPAQHCQPVFPHQFLLVNSVFDVLHQQHLPTAWMDKHPAYEFVSGHQGNAVDDLYTPEIGANYEGKTTLNNQIARSLDKTEQYDADKIHALMQQLQGQGHDGQHPGSVPVLLGLNLQAVSVAQKLYGYLPHRLPSPALAQALLATDALLRQLQDTLSAQHLDAATLIIVTAKHGNSPINSQKIRHIEEKQLRAAIESAAPGALVHLIADDGALIWLKSATARPAVMQYLKQHHQQLGIHRVLDSQGTVLHWPANNRTPDLVLEADYGVIYGAAHTRKKAEHGGFNDEDRHVALLIRDGYPAQQIHQSVSTLQVAPTILSALGLNPEALDSVQQHLCRNLPALHWIPPARID